MPSMVLVLEDPSVKSLTLSAILEKGSYVIFTFIHLQSLFNYFFFSRQRGRVVKHQT